MWPFHPRPTFVRRIFFHFSFGFFSVFLFIHLSISLSLSSAVKDLVGKPQNTSGAHSGRPFRFFFSRINSVVFPYSCWEPAWLRALLAHRYSSKTKPLQEKKRPAIPFPQTPQPLLRFFPIDSSLACNVPISPSLTSIINAREPMLVDFRSSSSWFFFFFGWGGLRFLLLLFFFTFCSVFVQSAHTCQIKSWNLSP